MNLLARLAALEARRGPDTGPWCALVLVAGDGTAVTLAYRDDAPELATLAEYRRRYGAGHPQESWTVLDGATPIDDRLPASLAHWRGVG